MMKERRQFVRLDARLPITYRLLPSSDLQASSTKDIGGGGIRLSVSEPLTPGTPLEVTIKLPNREESITVTGVVVWCEQSDVVDKTQQARSVEAGVKFVYMNPEDQQAIMQHVSAHLQSRHKA
jgi:c-di-GMP-binding flagellar brake protein YcgR